jgi:hypothetical protein
MPVVDRSQFASHQSSSSSGEDQCKNPNLNERKNENARRELMMHAPAVISAFHFYKYAFTIFSAFYKKSRIVMH